MSNIPPPPGGFPPPPGQPGGFPPPGGQPGGFPPPGGAPGQPGGFPPPGGGQPGGFPPPGGGGFPPPGGGGFPPPGGGGYGAPAGQPVEWQDRLVSGLIDWLGPSIAAGVINQVLSLADIPFVGLLISLAAFGWTLYNGYLAGETGQSTGMKQSGLRLVGEQTGQNIGGTQGLLRNLLFLPFACTCGLLTIVDSLFPLWDAKKQTIRDKVVKAIVVRA